MILNIFKRKKTKLFFIPNPKKDNCGVSFINDILRSPYRVYFNWFNLIRIPDSTPHFKEVVQSPINLKRTIVFAHGNKSKNGMVLNGYDDPIQVRSWWYKDDINFGLVYAHICWGGVFLREKTWISIFPFCVSHNAKIYVSKGPRKINNIWKDIYNQILCKVESSNNIEEMYTNISNVYEETFERIFLENEEKLDYKMFYTLMFINNSNNSLTKISNN